METTPATLSPEAPELAGEIAIERATLVEQMEALRQITTEAEAEHATRLIQKGKNVARAVEEWFKPLVEAAYKAHKSLTERRAESKADIESESGRLQSELNRYLTAKREALEAERRRKEEEARLAREEEARIERERQEAERLAEAKRLEEEAQRLEAQAARARDHNPEPGMFSFPMYEDPSEGGGIVGEIDASAAREMEEEAQRLEAQAARAREAAAAKLEEAIEVPTPSAPVIPAAAPVKVSSLGPAVKGTAVRQVWKYEITDPMAIPREFLKIDESAIAAYVKVRKGDTTIAGVRVFSELETSIRK